MTTLDLRGSTGTLRLAPNGGSATVRSFLVTGPTGPTGPAGVTGPTGPTGPASTVPGPAGPQGLPGVNAVANDTATAGYVTTAGSATQAALRTVAVPSAQRGDYAAREAVHIFDFLSTAEKADAITGQATGAAPTLTTTTAWQAAINYCLLFGKTLQVTGSFRVGALTVDGGATTRRSLRIVGETQERDVARTESTNRGAVLNLASGTNDNMFTITRDTAPIMLENLRLRGNSSGQTTGTSWAVSFSDDLTGARSRSGEMRNVYIDGFRTGGIYVGQQRNAFHLVDAVIINLAAGATGVKISTSYDHRFERFDIGAFTNNSGTGLDYVNGYSLRLSHGDFFLLSVGFRATTTAGYFSLTDVAFDAVDEAVVSQGAVINGQIQAHILDGPKFRGCGGLAAFSAIRAEDELGLIVRSPVFEGQAWTSDTTVSIPFQLIQCNGATDNVVWTGAKYNMADAFPVSTFVNLSTITAGDSVTVTVTGGDPTAAASVNSYVSLNSPALPGDYLFGRVTATTSTTVTMLVLKKAGTDTVSDFTLYARRQFVKDVASNPDKLVSSGAEYGTTAANRRDSIHYRNRGKRLVVGDASVTVSSRTSYGTYRFDTPLTTTRTLTLNTTAFADGDEIRVIRSAASTGSSLLAVGSVVSLATGQWCRIVFDSASTTWKLAEAGTHSITDTSGDRAAFRRTGALAETAVRTGATWVNSSALATGTMRLVAVYLPAGVTVSKIGFVSGTQAAVTPTNQWFALYDSGLNLLGATADDTTTAWAASVEKQLTLTSPVTTSAAGLYYLGALVKATTPPSLQVTSSAGAVLGLPPILSGVDSTHTGLTDPTTAPAVAAIAAASVTPYGWIG